MRFPSLAGPLLVLTPLAWAQQAAPEPSARAPDLRFAPQRWALVIGANDYEHLGALRYARDDARAFAAALEEHLGFSAEGVKLLTDDAQDPELLPTAGHVLGELEVLLGDPRRTRSDLFVFYFCGHGAGLAEGDFLLPTDARLETAARLGLPVKEVVERLTQAGMSNVLVIVDACREGAAHEFGRELEQLATQARLGVVLGCAPGQQSYEEARLGHGQFTHKLLAALADEALREPASGALWFSRVTGAAAEAVRAATARKRPPQEPALWCDATRDVLLSAAPPAALGAEGLAAFLGEAAQLGPEAHAAALARYAEELSGAGRAEDCVQVLKTAEQLAPLAPPSAFLLYSSLLGLGRTSEAARVLFELRAREPGTLHAQVATVIDQSGAVNDTERSLAARELWQSGTRVPFDVLMLMVQAHLRSGANAEALEIAQSALEQAPVDSGDGAFLAAVVALLSGDSARAAQEFERAEGYLGGLFEREVLRAERLSVLAKAGRRAEALALFARCIEDWPQSGRWLAERAWFERQSANSLADLDLAFEDARAALAGELLPAQLLLLVRAAGSRVTELGAEVARHAEPYPLSWEAQLAAVMATQPTELKDAVAAVARLSARPGLVYATMGRLTFDALIEQSLRMDALKGPDAPETQALGAVFGDALRTLQERLTPMAADFGADASSWSLLSELYRRQGHYEAFVRLCERHLGPTIAAGRVPDELAQVLGPAWLNSGRLERFRTLTSVPRGPVTSDSLAWLEASYLASRGADAEARAGLGARTQPLDSSQRELAAPLVALLRARAGEREAARELLAGVEPERDPLALALHYLALRACADEGAERWLAQLSTTTPLDAYFAFDACMRARPGRDPREAAVFALPEPGNPLLAEHDFLAEASLEAFVGAQQYTLEHAPGPLTVAGGTLTLTVLKSGKVVGALVVSESAALVVQGQVDARGNFEGQLSGGPEPCTLLAKLVPRRAFDEYEPLAEGWQPMMLLAQSGLPFPWLTRIVR